MAEHDWSTGEHYSYAWVVYITETMFSVATSIWLSLVILTSRKARRSSANVLLLGLASSIFMFSITCGLQCILNIHSGLFVHGEWACKFQAFCHYVFMSIHVIILAVIAWRSYLAVVKNQIMSCKAAFYWIVFSYFISFALVLPLGFASELYLQPSGTYCFFAYASPINAGFFIPLLFLTIGFQAVVYYKTYLYVKAVRSKIVDTSTGLKALNSRISVARKMSAYVLTLLMCWGFALVCMIYEFSMSQHIPAGMDMTLAFLGAAHGYIDCILYGIQNPKLRKDFTNRLMAWGRRSLSSKSVASPSSGTRLSRRSSTVYRDSEDGGGTVSATGGSNGGTGGRYSMECESPVTSNVPLLKSSGTVREVFHISVIAEAADPSMGKHTNLVVMVDKAVQVISGRDEKDVLRSSVEVQADKMEIRRAVQQHAASQITEKPTSVVTLTQHHQHNNNNNNNSNNNNSGNNNNNNNNSGSNRTTNCDAVYIELHEDNVANESEAVHQPTATVAQVQAQHHSEVPLSARREKADAAVNTTDTPSTPTDSTLPRALETKQVQVKAAVAPSIEHTANQVAGQVAGQGATLVARQDEQVMKEVSPRGESEVKCPFNVPDL